MHMTTKRNIFAQHKKEYGKASRGRKKRDTGCGVYRDRYIPQVCGPHIQEIAEERSASSSEDMRKNGVVW
jgi:hypothetical protein